MVLSANYLSCSRNTGGAAEREGRTSGDPGQFCPEADPLIYNGYREDECSRASDDENDFAPENIDLECGSLLERYMYANSF